MSALPHFSAGQAADGFDSAMPADRAEPRLLLAITRALVVPLIVTAAALALWVNERNYKKTDEAVRYGRLLVEARIAAAGVLQLLTDAETGQRGYLLTNRTEYLEPLLAAKLAIPRIRSTVAAFLDASGADGHAASLRVDKDIQETLSEIDKTVQLARSGDRAAALRVVEAGQGKRRMQDMRNTLQTSLIDAARRQQVSRVAVDRALQTSRAALALLTLFGALALILSVRHTRRDERQRADRQLDLESQVRERTVELRQLAGYLVTAREDEKAHLARELHDELGGLLSAAKLDVLRMRKLAAADPALLERIEQIGQRLSEGIVLKRRIVEDLRPSCLDTLGLTISLSNLCTDVSAQLGIPIHTAFDEVSLSAEAQLALYRLVQEALTNVSKYARASQVHVSLKSDPAFVRVDIRDDGVGFDAAKLKHQTHGIAGMRFRIERLEGSMTVESGPGRGTHLVGELPAPAPAGVATDVAAIAGRKSPHNQAPPNSA